MCGFVGVISKGGAAFPRATLEKMGSMIAHRGPDDSGVFTDGDWLSMAFRRLKIIELSEKGHQPMLSDDRRHAIVYNGEVYNFKELRAELEASGVAFNSESDTEVVLKSYLKWGRDCVKKFNGMFAFMIADTMEKTAFVARDHLGIKPLFHHEDANFHIFASEAKCLLPYKNLELEPKSVNEYLVFRSLPGRETMFKNVFSLRPGSRMEIKGGRINESQYFSLADTLDAPPLKKSFGEVCEETEALLKESVRLHLRSDVELGVQLSGGVDSSLLTAMASKETSRRFHTFSISFEESFYDESEYQRRISSRYGTTHHNYTMEEHSFTDGLLKSIWHFEHPLNDPNVVCTRHLCENARKHVTVMLSGEGADESFMGYSRFNKKSVARLRFRNWLHKSGQMRALVSRLWPLRQGKQLLNITKYSPPMYVLTYADLNVVDLLLNGHDSDMKYRRSIARLARGDTLREAILQDEMCDLQQWFWRADRIGMASSMELRVPFCTAPMFQLANSIPYELKLHNGERKAVLKKVAEKYMDHDQIYRKKIGFGTPIDEWISSKKHNPYKEMFEDCMESREFKNRPFIEYQHVRPIYEAHKNGRYREVNSAFLWTYFNLELWHRIFFEGGWKKFTEN